MNLAEIISVIESHAPLALQESYDNAGLATVMPICRCDLPCYALMLPKE